MNNLLRHSKKIILDNQHESGAYIASPNFPTYHYSWFRDGSYIAYSMDVVGEFDSSKRFHNWVAKMINERKETILRAIDKSNNGEKIEEEDYLHTRYSLIGQVSNEEWPNFQLDGFGTWLWALELHQKLSGEILSKEILSAANILSNYLSALWEQPCFDCWEENPDQNHPHTLAAIYGGLKAEMNLNQSDHFETIAKIKNYVLDKGIKEGHFSKYIGNEEVDASLIGLSTPYNMIEPNDKVMKETINKICLDLQKGGGVHRFAADTFYGGGEWILLTAWLGWHHLKSADVVKAKESLRWIEQQASSDFELPEQIHVNLNDESYLSEWQERWGNIAKPLLWSHAMYLILYTEINNF